MARCDVCGNDYDKSFTVTPIRGEAKTFDSVRVCAIHALAPTCSHCGIKIVGHGMEKAGSCLLLRQLRDPGGGQWG
jgi:hypothetical protein